MAANPSSTGIRMSMTTTSGTSRRVTSTASRPSPANPTTSMSPAVPNSVASP